jgi:peptidoglycan hydrolase-like protein with peptidoglycan-binding domain
MRSLLHQRSSRAILAALAVGSLALPAAASARRQSAATHKTAHTASSAKSVSSPTSKSAKSKKSSSHKSKRVRGQAAPTPERINEIQSALARQGTYAGEPTGKWDDSTSEAMKQFQSKHGLNPTGKYDALTLQKLGLGSETAGLGAPTPPPNAAANRLLSQKVQRDEVKNEPE